MYVPLQKMGKDAFMEQISINVGRPISVKNTMLGLGNLL